MPGIIEMRRNPSERRRTVEIKLEAWGDYACFTRPEFKTERVSYDVMTPSAAKGILESIYWHPGMRYTIKTIQVCNPIQFLNMKRNEVSAVASGANARTVMTGGKADLWLATPTCIQQRATMMLRDVRYIITAEFELTEKASDRDNIRKFEDIITRRIEKGQFYHKPCFGCREFPAHFKPCTEAHACPPDLKGEKDLGFMLWGMNYSNPRNITPMFYRPQMKDGVIMVPDEKSGGVFG